MIESGTKVGIFQIEITCADCAGVGQTVHQIAHDVYAIRICDFCNGDGFNTHEAAYDSLADAGVDYPNAIDIREANDGNY